MTGQAHQGIVKMATKAGASSTSLDIPNALLVYTRDNGKRQVIHVPPKKGEENKTAHVVIEKYVKDARKAKPTPKFTEHGFELIAHKTVLSKNDFYTNPNEKIEKTYYKEMVEAVKKLCPNAAEVIPFHHMVKIAFDNVNSFVLLRFL